MPFRDHTKAIYADTIEEMLQTTSFEKIRIKDLCEKCGADRQNFYYHFNDKYALVEWIFERDFAAALSENNGGVGIGTLASIMQKIKERSKFYKKVFSDNSQYSLKNHLYEVSSEMSRRILIDYTGNASLTDEQAFMISFLSYGWLGNMTEWLNNGCKIPTLEFAEMQFGMFPDIIRKAYDSYAAGSEDVNNVDEE